MARRASGHSPRRIARELNAERVPGPGGRPWGDTTIRGQTERGTGLLNNSVYVGLLEWNRCSYVKDPRTGRRVARVNTQQKRERKEVPELRIIDDALWQTVKARQAENSFSIGRSDTGVVLNRAHRSKFLLSGLLRCSCCGGGYTIIAKERYGCATRRSKANCSNGQTILRPRLEARVLSGLKDRMLAPDLVAEFMRAFAEETAALQRESAGASARLSRELADIERRLQGILAAVANGAWSDTVQARLTELERCKADLTRTIAAANSPAPSVKLHPNAAELYRRKVTELETALAQPDIASELDSYEVSLQALSAAAR